MKAVFYKILLYSIRKEKVWGCLTMLWLLAFQRMLKNGLSCDVSGQILDPKIILITLAGKTRAMYMLRFGAALSTWACGTFS